MKTGLCVEFSGFRLGVVEVFAFRRWTSRYQSVEMCRRVEPSELVDLSTESRGATFEMTDIVEVVVGKPQIAFSIFKSSFKKAITGSRELRSTV